MAEYVRLTRRQLQTSIHRYTHPDSGRRVVVIGMHHVGEPGYFAGLRAVLNAVEADGGVVHCEGARLLPCSAPDVTTQEQQLLEDLRRGDELQAHRLAELGWLGQIDGLGYPPHWRVIDLSYLQIMRRLGTPATRQLADRKIRAFAWPDADHRGIHRLRLRIALATRIAARDRYVARVDHRDPADRVLLDGRTAVALDGVAATERDAALARGVQHVPGLVAGLRDQGFVRTEEVAWHTVAEMPTIRAALWRLATATQDHRSVGTLRRPAASASARHHPEVADPLATTSEPSAAA
jgi:hypothetical protein